MVYNLEELYTKLDSILSEQDKPFLRRVVLLHREREQKLLNENEIYKDDVIKGEKDYDAMLAQFEKLTDKMVHDEKVKFKMQMKISKFKKDRKELLSQKQGAAISRGRLNSKYEQVIEAMEVIHETCDKSRFTNIQNLKRKIKNICHDYINFCDRCEEPIYRCNCK